MSHYEERLFLKSTARGTFVPTFGERLREERQRLGLSQDALAVLCSVTKRTQGNYERNEREADTTYLAAAAAAGIDIQFVVTGERVSPLEQAQALAAAPGVGAAALLQELLCVQEPAGTYSTVELSAAEAKLVASWRACEQLDQQTLVVLAERLARVTKEPSDAT